MSVLDFVWKLMTALHPSPDPDIEVQMAWRWSVAFSILAGACIIGGGLSWAQGWIPGVSGVALKSDMQNVNMQIADLSTALTSIRLGQIKAAIVEALVNSCTAQQRRNQDALNRANDDLYGRNGAPGLLDQYRQLAGQPYILPSCKEILITPDP